jgi:DNA-binding Xre family transcriptional regulator
VSGATIIRLENTEEVVINTGTLEKLANALNVSIKSLFLP